MLVRHGETTHNYNRTFTGWIDVDLSETGRREVEHAAHLLLEKGYKVDVTYTSRLKRAIRSVFILLISLNQIYKPVFKSWRLNERMYGELEGLSKPAVAQQFGEEIVQEFRRGLHSRPPPMSETHPHWHGQERKYADLSAEELPLTESLQDTMDRTTPLWETRILPDLKAGKNVLIVAHANSLRGIVKLIDNITAEDITKVGIPNGIPLVYKFDHEMRPLTQERAVYPLSGEFLEKKGLLRAALDREQELAQSVFGFNATDSVNGNGGKPLEVITLQKNGKTQFDDVINGLSSLNRNRQLIGLAAQSTSNVTSRDTAISTAATTHQASPYLLRTLNSTKSCPRNSSAPACKQSGEYCERALNISHSHQQLIVIIRHGKTAYNKLGIFTGMCIICGDARSLTHFSHATMHYSAGWEDAPLIDEGRAEAKAAGALLRRHGIQFDAVYTSWLSRAIETAYAVLEELDLLWLPMSKTWRLNERMYANRLVTCNNTVSH